MAQHNDAFNRPIVIGHQYAYSTGNNGITYVIQGVAKRMSEKKVSIRVERELCYVYGKPNVGHNELRSKGDTRSVYGCILFPYIEQSEAPKPPVSSPRTKDDDTFVLEA